MFLLDEHLLSICEDDHENMNDNGEGPCRSPDHTRSWNVSPRRRVPLGSHPAAWRCFLTEGLRSAQPSRPVLLPHNSYSQPPTPFPSLEFSHPALGVDRSPVIKLLRGRGSSVLWCGFPAGPWEWGTSKALQWEAQAWCGYQPWRWMASLAPVHLAKEGRCWSGVEGGALAPVRTSQLPTPRGLL